MFLKFLRSFLNLLRSVADSFVVEVDITFTKQDLRDVVPHDNDPIVISLITAGGRFTEFWWTKEVRQT